MFGNDVTIGDGLIVVDCVTDIRGVCETVNAVVTVWLYVGLGVGVTLMVALFVLYVDTLVVGVG